MPVEGAWKLTSGQRLQRRCWDDECVVFNDLTGDTHLLGADAVLVLLRLAERAQTPAALVALLGEAGADADEQGCRQLLDGLHSLSLIEPCPQ
jgi:PqqD family protein of HPr-rel-A system